MAQWEKCGRTSRPARRLCVQSLTPRFPRHTMQWQTRASGRRLWTQSLPEAPEGKGKEDLIVTRRHDTTCVPPQPMESWCVERSHWR